MTWNQTTGKEIGENIPDFKSSKKSDLHAYDIKQLEYRN